MQMSADRLGVVREHLSPDLLYACHLYAQLAADIESEKDHKRDTWVLEHRSHVIASVLTAVSFLEAAINELYYVTTDQLLDTSRVSETSKKRLSPIWKVESFQRGAKLYEKYQTATLLLEVVPFDEGEALYQNFKLLCELRNAIVHFTPETEIIKMDPEQSELHKLEKRLNGKFDLNPFAAKFPVVDGKMPHKRANYPFFPERCLGYGCAKWACNVALSFANAFFKKIGTEWHYHAIESRLPTLK
jgi:hypothetical protein